MSGETFGAMLRRLREATPGYAGGNRFQPSRKCLSQVALAKLAGIDVSYVNHLEVGRSGWRGQNRRVQRDVVLRLARALTLDDDETDCLLHAAGQGTVADWQSIAERWRERAELAESIVEEVRESVGVFATVAKPTMIRSRAV